MKKTILLFMALLPLLICAQVETIYSNPDLEGFIIAAVDSVGEISSAQMFGPLETKLFAGDGYAMLTGTNLFSAISYRSYLSFPIDRLNVEIDSVTFNIYQCGYELQVVGDSVCASFPRLYGENCLIAHVDYGEFLSPNCFYPLTTSFFNDPISTDDGEMIGRKSLNVTEAYVQDKQNQKVNFQVMISFQSLTDYDGFSDLIFFQDSHTRNSYEKPQLTIFYHTVENEDVYEVPQVNLYPNPCMGKFTVFGKNISRVSIYNTKGQLIQRVVPPKQQESIVLNIDSNNGSGVYIVKTHLFDNTVMTNKVYKIK